MNIKIHWKQYSCNDRPQLSTFLWQHHYCCMQQNKEKFSLWPSLGETDPRLPVTQQLSQYTRAHVGRKSAVCRQAMLASKSVHIKRKGTKQVI